jgi:hypothetical protein
MLKHSHEFWAEAVSTAVYLRNRCPTKAINGMTPHEAWHGYKQQYDTYRFLGVMDMHTLRDEREKV